MSNPLLQTHTLPPFSQILPEHIEVAITQLLDEARAQTLALLSQEDAFTWANLMAPLDDIDDKLSQAWSPVGHLNSVMNSDALRDAYNACLPKLSEYSTEMGQNKDLYAAFKQVAESAEFATLETAQQKTITNALRDFRLSGIALAAKDQKRYGDLKKRLSELNSKYSENVLDATQAWSKLLKSADELPGLPESALQAAEQSAKSKELEGYLINLEFPSYLPVMTYCEDRALRQEVYTAFSTRASDQGPNAGEWDNNPLIKEILQLRQELAQLLDFSSYAELSLATKMAESESGVVDFLWDLADKSKPYAEKDLAELKAYAKAEFGADELEAWDLTFYAEKLKQHTYAISQEELRPYFPAAKVIGGMFEVVNRLFNIDIKQIADIDVWHSDVAFYEVSREGQTLGSFYLDLYARENKRGGAWMDDCRVRRLTANGMQLPVAYLTCNFNGPVGGKPALLTHDEVTTLFHEFGHGLHHMLTQVEYAGVSGINGVAWDAVELPSQFMENWCWQPEGIALISAHYESGEALPQAMLDKLLAAKNFQSGMMMVRQLEFSLFDFILHQSAEADVQEVLARVRERVAVIKAPASNRFQCSFSHIFAGGYAAGYYSYKWAEVLSADAFSRFEEQGVFDAQCGADFLHKILEKGGSQEPMALFVDFMGREPKVDALLRHCGIGA